MSFQENPTLEGTRIGSVIDSVKSTFESNFKDSNTTKILAGMSCDKDNVNYLVCMFSIPYISPKIVINEDYMKLQQALFYFSKIEKSDYSIEDLKIQYSDNPCNTLKVSFGVRCTF